MKLRKLLKLPLLLVTNAKLRAILILVVVLAVLYPIYREVSKPVPPPREEPRPFVWYVEMDELARMEIRLPPLELLEAWVKHEDRYWYFDQPDGPKVNMERWGGGIPLLLSGPGANRLIAEDATEEQLEIFGLTEPTVEIELTLDTGEIIDIILGDATPDGQGYYIKLLESADVYTVDYTWFGVIARLVLDPPYPVPEEEEED